MLIIYVSLVEGILPMNNKFKLARLWHGAIKFMLQLLTPLDLMEFTLILAIPLSSVWMEGLLVNVPLKIMVSSMLSYQFQESAILVPMTNPRTNSSNLLIVAIRVSMPMEMEKRVLLNVPLIFIRTWVNDPLKAQQMAEKVTRKTIGVKCCPVAGIPEPREEEELEEELELAHELNLQ
jgi:hypothetical protein